MNYLMTAPDVNERAARVKLLILDVDGVLTDGRVVYGSGGIEMKFFDIKDGHGLMLLQKAGIEVALLSGRESEVNRRRAKDMHIDEVYENVKFKKPVMREILKTHGLAAEDLAYMGDDLIDLPAMRMVGLAMAPADAVPEVLAEAHWVAGLPGGRGAVRQGCELILKAKGDWEEVARRYHPD